MSLVGITFVSLTSTAGFAMVSRNRSPAIVVRMGLYDTPLPPRPPPQQDSKKNKKPVADNMEEDDGDDGESMEIERLFEFGEDGKEIRGLLPSLKRRLKSGVACYFEPTDSLAKNLVNKTSCRPDDACWALEACEGDITESWTRISMARRFMLNKSRNTMLLDEDLEYDEDDYDIEVFDEFLQRKNDLSDDNKKRRRVMYFTPSGPDAQWLPTKNPNPIDDKPWFTG